MIKSLNSKILNVIILIGIFITGVLLLATPMISIALFKTQIPISQLNSIMINVSICVYLCFIPYMISLFKLKKLCRLIIKNIPFTMASSKALKTISICSFSEIIIFSGCLLYLKYFVIPFNDTLIIPAIIVVTFVCLVIGLLCLTLSQLFETATKIKDENDKTI
ncbi:DUF2975 domain-containing protein [Romboutsia sp. 1001713B170131_170501_G6]|uniref:DUF2975 domain-containing protein n=1 Tax=Romboutsia sp. 1001713B170131_170501_G6 TaxID=2787108 RepID=UPI0018AB9F7D|nr:DUF2975 domain-containing protein [Romboutsia sp. 1001713B170131_170501_G6]